MDENQTSRPCNSAFVLAYAQTRGRFAYVTVIAPVTSPPLVTPPVLCAKIHR